MNNTFNYIYYSDKVAIFSPTKQCNLRCSYCLDSKNISNAINDFVFDSVLWGDLIDDKWTIEISGGEPFLHNRTVDFANALIERGGDVLIYTNGHNLKKIEQKLSEEVCLLCCWHSSYVDIGDFFCQSVRNKTVYKYMIHPQRVEMGLVNKDLMTWERESGGSEIRLDFFRGYYNGQRYDCSHKIYDEYRIRQLRFDGNLFPYIKKKYLSIDQDGSLYPNYHFFCKIGDVVNYSMEILNKIPVIMFDDMEKETMKITDYRNYTFEERIETTKKLSGCKRVELKNGTVSLFY